MAAGVLRSLAWGTAGAAVAAAMFGAARDDFAFPTLVRAFLVGMSYAASIGIPTTMVFALLSPRLRESQPLTQALGAMGVLLTLVTAGGLAVSLLWVKLGVFEARGFWGVFRASAAVALAFTAAWSSGAIAYERLRQRRDAIQRRLESTELERRRAEALAIQAQLDSLEKRVHPHFLFNALNAVLALIPESPQRAEHVLERLAALLRFSLDASAHRLHPLAQEMAVVVDYLEIEKARFEERLRFTLELPAECQSVRVPPFSVQTLVENAVKHVVARRREGGELTVRARCEPNGLVIAVTDDGPGFGEEALRVGHGLQSLRARLGALYGEGASLAITSGAPGGKVELRLPFRKETNA